MLQQLACALMCRHPQGDPVKSGTGQAGNWAVGPAMQNQCHRTGPEGIGQQPGCRCFDAERECVLR